MNNIFNKKTIISFIVLVLVIIGLLLIPKKGHIEEYIILDEYKLKYQDGVISFAPDKEVKDRTFRLLHDSGYIGNYSLVRKDDDTDNLVFKDAEKEVIVKKPLLGLSDNIIFVSDKVVGDLEEKDFKKYKKLVENVDYSLQDLSMSYKVMLTNKDGELTGLNICTAQYEAELPEDDYSVLFVEMGDRTIILDESIPEEIDGNLVQTTFEVAYILDINGDGRFELVVSNYRYDKAEYSIFKLYDDFDLLFYTGS